MTIDPKEQTLNFHELGLNKAILRTLEEIGHTEATPIQSKAIPPVLEGRDVVGLAQTGTGKTAAFLLPLLQRLNKPDHTGKFRPIRTLVITPTRELAAQIFEKARQYGKSLNLRSQCTVGGIPIAKQEKLLTRGADILIATPGRLLDLAKRGAVSFEHVEAIVLDEADHMLDIGFLPDVKRIVAQLPYSRQTLLFSATMPKAIAELAADYLDNPVNISVARTASVAEKIDQSVKHVHHRQKHNELVSLIGQNKKQRIVVFARTKHGSDKIVRRLKTVDIEAAAIHGNKSQGQRERALKAFTNGDILVLVATDIAARGIDIKDVGVVVNYELPNVPEVYVHRIGRTARAGTSGIAVSFCSEDEVKHLRNIEKLIGMSIPAEGDVIEPANDERGKSKPARKRTRNSARNTSNNSRKNEQVKSDSHQKSSDNDRAGIAPNKNKSRRKSKPLHGHEGETRESKPNHNRNRHPNHKKRNQRNFKKAS